MKHLLQILIFPLIQPLGLNRPLHAMIKLLLHVLCKFTDGDRLLPFDLRNNTLVFQEFIKSGFFGVEVQTLQEGDSFTFAYFAFKSFSIYWSRPLSAVYEGLPCLACSFTFGSSGNRIAFELEDHKSCLIFMTGLDRTRSSFSKQHRQPPAITPFLSDNFPLRCLFPSYPKEISSTSRSKSFPSLRASSISFASSSFSNRIDLIFHSLIGLPVKFLHFLLVGLDVLNLPFDQLFPKGYPGKNIHPLFYFF